MKQFAIAAAMLLVLTAEISAQSSISHSDLARAEELVAFMESKWDSLERHYDVHEAEALVFIMASREFNMGLLEVARTYHHVMSRSSGIEITDAEQDVLSLERFREIGFEEVGGRWYYGNREVTMGEQFKTPESLKARAPDRSAINVHIGLTSMRYDPLTQDITIVAETNLPEGMSLMSNLKLNGAIRWQDKESVANGKVVFEFQNLSRGSYEFSITSPAASVQPASVKKLIGETGQNLLGELVEYSPVWRKQVRFSKAFAIQ